MSFRPFLLVLLSILYTSQLFATSLNHNHFTIEKQKSYRIAKSDLFQLQEQNPIVSKVIDKEFKLKSIDDQWVELNFSNKKKKIIGPDSFLYKTGLSFINWVVRKDRARKYKKAKSKYPNRLRILAEGDSWYHHPLQNDIVDYLNKHFNVKSIAAAGDDLTKVYAHGEYRKFLDQENPHIFILSGGGNDILNENMPRFLKYYHPDLTNEGPSRLLNGSFDLKMDELMAIYEDIFSELEVSNPDMLVMIHGYDYVIPNNGPYLGRPMINKKILRSAEQKEIMGFVVDQFNKRLQAVANKYSNVIYIDFRKNTPINEWGDEIHPTPKGFRILANEFISIIRKRYFLNP